MSLHLSRCLSVCFSVQFCSTETLVSNFQFRLRSSTYLVLSSIELLLLNVRSVRLNSDFSCWHSLPNHVCLG